jgi:Tfp pilus assembly protein PilW
MRRAWILLVLAAAACGTPAPPPPATVHTVALRASDLPKGMVACGSSGDIDTFLKAAPPNNQYASQVESDWNAFKANGAQEGDVHVFATSKDDCAKLFTTSTSNPMPVVIAMVVQFKTAKAASATYAQADVQQSQISSLPGAEQGTATGLGKNSLTFGDTEGSQSLFYSYWQTARFLVLLLAVDIGTTPALKAAQHVNSRIH